MEEISRRSHLRSRLEAFRRNNHLNFRAYPRCEAHLPFPNMCSPIPCQVSPARLLNPLLHRQTIRRGRDSLHSRNRDSLIRSPDNPLSPLNLLSLHNQLHRLRIVCRGRVSTRFRSRHTWPLMAHSCRCLRPRRRLSRQFSTRLPRLHHRFGHPFQVSTRFRRLHRCPEQVPRLSEPGVWACTC